MNKNTKTFTALVLKDLEGSKWKYPMTTINILIVKYSLAVVLI